MFTNRKFQRESSQATCVAYYPAMSVAIESFQILDIVGTSCVSSSYSSACVATLGHTTIQPRVQVSRHHAQLIHFNTCSNNLSQKNANLKETTCNIHMRYIFSDVCVNIVLHKTQDEISLQKISFYRLYDTKSQNENVKAGNYLVIYEKVQRKSNGTCSS